MSKKDLMVDGAHRRICMPHPRFNKADFCRKGKGQVRSSGGQVGSWFRMNTSSLHGVISPIYLRRMVI